MSHRASGELLVNVHGSLGNRRVYNDALLGGIPLGGDLRIARESRQRGSSNSAHSCQGANEPYAYCYLFAYGLELPDGATTLTLPDNDKIRIMAVTVAEEQGTVHPAQPLVDTQEESRR